MSTSNSNKSDTLSDTSETNTVVDQPHAFVTGHIGEANDKNPSDIKITKSYDSLPRMAETALQLSPKQSGHLTDVIQHQPRPLTELNTSVQQQQQFATQRPQQFTQQPQQFAPLQQQHFAP